MSATTIGGSSRDLLVSGVTTSRPTTSASVAHPRSQSSRPPGISSDAEMLTKLVELRTSQPSRFRDVSREITSRLQAKADDQGGDVGKQLDQLADKFAEAARTGDMSALRPSVGARSPGGYVRGADAYRQSAQKVSRGSGIEQIISDALKDITASSK